MEVDVLLARVHVRLARLVTAVFTRSTRRILEGFSLLFAVALLVLLVFLHLQFISEPSCLVKEIQESAGIKSPTMPLNTSTVPWHVLRIKVSGFWERQLSSFRQRLQNNKLRPLPSRNPSLSSSTSSTSSSSSSTYSFSSDASSDASSSSPETSSEMNMDPNHRMVEDLSTIGRKGRILEEEEAQNENEMEEVETREEKEEEEEEEAQRVRKSSTPLFDFLASNFPWLRELAGDNSETHNTPLPSSFFFTEQDRMFRRDKTQDFIEELYAAFAGDLSFQFSFERGYLFLRDELKARHGIIVHNITLHSNDSCFGSTELSSVLENVMGYDTVVVNSLIHAFKGRGYFYNLQTQEIYNLYMVTEMSEMGKYLEDYLTLKVGMVVTSALLYLVSVTVVSFALRETQVRVLNFSLLLHRMSRVHLSVGKLILFHILQCIVFVVIMIGILYCIAEILDDTFLALLLLSHIWMGELYTMICTRTRTATRYFPKFFYLYFLLFSIYFFSFPFGFYYLAFFCMSSFVQHSMLYFYNRFELPALEAGTVHLRPSIIFQSFVTTPTPTPTPSQTTTTTAAGEPGRQVMAHTLVPEHHSQGVEEREVERSDRTEAGNRGAGEEEEGEEEGVGFVDMELEIEIEDGDEVAVEVAGI